MDFLLYYFFNSKHFLNCFSQFFFVKCSNNLFVVKIINNIYPRHSTLTFSIAKYCSDLFGTQPFSKMFLYFDILTLSPTLNLGPTFLFIFFVKVIWLGIDSFHFSFSMICIAVFVNYPL